MRRYDIFAKVAKPKKMPCLPTNDMDILGRRRVGDSLQGDLVIPPNALLAIPYLFLGGEVYYEFSAKRAEASRILAS